MPEPCADHPSMAANTASEAQQFVPATVPTTSSALYRDEYLSSLIRANMARLPAIHRAVHELYDMVGFLPRASLFCICHSD